MLISTPPTTNLIALFRRLGDVLLRIGGGPVDQILWRTNEDGTHAQVTASNIKALAGFLQATGWPCFTASTSLPPLPLWQPQKWLMQSRLWAPTCSASRSATILTSTV
jgi:hypothetical protein